MKPYLTPSADLIFTQSEDVLTTSPITYGDVGYMDDPKEHFDGFTWPGSN